MQDKHICFIKNLQKLSTTATDNRPLLECITKEYILNEGIKDVVTAPYRYMKNLASNAANHAINAVVPKITERPTPKQVKQDSSNLSMHDKELIREDARTFRTDFPKFLDACLTLIEYMKTYGDAEFIAYVLTPEFAKMYRRGNYIDSIRRNPMCEAMDRQMAMQKILESLRNKSNTAIIDVVAETFAITESRYGINIWPILESLDEDLDDEDIAEIEARDAKRRREEAASALRHTTLPTIALFIAKHGTVPWRRITQSKKFQNAKRIAEAMKQKNNE